MSKYVNSDLIDACKIGLSYINAVKSKVPRPIQDLEEDKKQVEIAIANTQLMITSSDLIAACEKYQKMIKLLFELNPDVKIKLGSALGLKQAQKLGDEVLAKLRGEE